MSKDQDFELSDFLIPEQTTASTTFNEEGLEEEEEQFYKIPRVITYQGNQLKIVPPDWRLSKLLKLQISTCFGCMVIVGMNDQTVGTLIPTLINYYQVEQTSISVVFVIQFLGFATSALSNEYFHNRFGRRGVMILSNVVLFLVYFVNSFKPPFKLFIIIYYFVGLGIGLMDSCMNVWLSSLVDHNELMGFLHGFYGVGAFIAPPFISYLLKWFDNDFKVYYMILSCITILSIVICALVFKNETKEKYHYDITKDESHEEGENQHQGGTLGIVLKMPLVWLFASYLFLYIGSEVSIGTWLLSYLLKIKELDQISASYIVSWFWIGLTLGRVLLGFITRFFKNEYRANLTYGILSLMFYIIYTIFTWNVTTSYKHFTLMTNIIVVISGVFIGPLFPTATITLMKILPSNLHVSSVGIMTSFGGSGSAILPFLIGIITHTMSLDILPILISILIFGYVLMWAVIPKISPIDYDF
ncbi:Glucose/galactose transporter [Wickerhamomyces ciferrii]|uniref:Glucose/galactose transporter n=1 Tax=Wickerhamomyces ciferrii (strain ATCC 14091 / BCRC 22168 / CBS 111 / JCM 3599 / NBRC 0793 / NRRL Y-1031 F-60-10) TaxID=1206466 RepID=K0KSD1_WICCF|nr:Glucose/galactose transporter [Wickerhamomyces ciferrii]CCH44922.1 Glucose/galactose transporter [Wickerhamomyces ciferrii]